MTLLVPELGADTKSIMICVALMTQVLAMAWLEQSTKQYEVEALTPVTP